MSSTTPKTADIVGSTAIPSGSSTPVPSSSTTSGPTPEIVIRFAESSPTDIERIAKLGRYVFGLTFAASTAPEDLERYLDEAYSPEAIKADIANPQKRVIVAEAKTQDDSGDSSTSLAGFAMIALDTTEHCLEGWTKPVELQRIYVDNAHHGGGVARKLEERVTQWAKEEGYGSIWLGVWENNDRAKRFYGKCGYEKIGTHDFVVGKQVDTDDIMAKRI